MTLIYASKYNEISTKLEQMRATVGASWSTVTTYGGGGQPAAAAGVMITAQQINNLIEAFNDFEAYWSAGGNCSATTYCSVTMACSGTAGDCSATGGSFRPVCGSNCQNQCTLNTGGNSSNYNPRYTGYSCGSMSLSNCRTVGR